MRSITRRLIQPDIRPWTMLLMALLPVFGLTSSIVELWGIDQTRIAEADVELALLRDAAAVHNLASELSAFETAAVATRAGFIAPQQDAEFRTLAEARLGLARERIKVALASESTSLVGPARATIERSYSDLKSLIASDGFSDGLDFAMRNSLSRDKFELGQIWNQLEFGLDEVSLANKVEQTRQIHNYVDALAAERLTIMRATSAGEAATIPGVVGASAVRSSTFALMVSGGHNPFDDHPTYASSDPGEVLLPWSHALVDGSRTDSMEWFALVDQVVEQAGSSIDGTLDELSEVRSSEITRTKRDRFFNAVLGIAFVTLAAGLFLVTRHEVQDRRRVEKAHQEAIDDLVVRAERDALTGLWNRTRTSKRLPELLEDSGDDAPVVLAYVDLDEFKPLNDIWGHQNGDEVLRVIAKRLERFVPESFEVVRFGGDEFVVYGVMPGADLPAVSDFGRRLVGEISQSMAIGDRRLVVEATVGLTFSGSEATTESDLLLEADAALILAKQRQRGSALVYDRELRRDAILLRALPAAFEADEIGAYFQPAFNMQTGECVAVEALARWTRADGEMVSPGEFIPLAESYGLMGRLTEAMLKQVGNLQRNDDMPDEIRIWLNISAVELDSRDFAERFIQAANAAYVNISTIGVEITETAAIRNPKNLSMALAALQRAGAQIAIDDFGNGYSPLGFLREIPFDVLKLDRSLVAAIHKNSDLQAMVQGIVSMTAQFDAEVVAEGIEEIEEFDWLANIGVDTAQGFLIARPMPVDALTTFLETPVDLKALRRAHMSSRV